MGLNYLHRAGVVHGYLNGVRRHFNGLPNSRGERLTSTYWPVLAVQYPARQRNTSTTHYKGLAALRGYFVGLLDCCFVASQDGSIGEVGWGWARFWVVFLSLLHNRDVCSNTQT